MICGTLLAAFCLLSPGVTDGDTIHAQTPWGRQGFRLWGVQAPERHEPEGPASTAHLEGLVEGELLACSLAGPPSFNRQVVTCLRVSDGADLACLQAAAGHAADWPFYSRGHYAACRP